MGDDNGDSVESGPVNLRSVTTVFLSPSPSFKKDFEKLDGKLKKIAERRLEDLVSKPSLLPNRVVPLIGTNGIYRIKVDNNYRISAELEQDAAQPTIMLLGVGPHSTIDKVRTRQQTGKRR